MLFSSFTSSEELAPIPNRTGNERYGLAMRKLSWASAMVMAFLTGMLNFAEPARASDLLQLSDGQLDKSTAGITASGAGTGVAQGMHTSSEATVTTAVGANGAIASAVGLVTSSASSTAPGVIATASSVLSLSIVIP